MRVLAPLFARFLELFRLGQPRGAGIGGVGLVATLPALGSHHLPHRRAIVAPLTSSKVPLECPYSACERAVPRAEIAGCPRSRRSQTDLVHPQHMQRKGGER